MKKLNWLMALMMVCTLSFVACEGKDVDETKTPGGNETKEFFQVEISDLTYSSVAFTVTPADTEKDYICALYSREIADEFTKDEYLVLTLMQELEAEARAVGKTLVEYLPEIVDRGVLEDEFEGLYAETDYYIVLFTVDLANNNATANVTKHLFTTEAFDNLSVTFDVETTVDGNTATYKITPSNNEDIWYFYTLPKATYDAYLDPEYYAMSEQQFLLYCMQMEIDAYRSAGYTDNQIMNSIFHQGPLTLQAKGLNANSEYINMIVGLIVTPEGQVTVATEVSTSTYTTGDAKAEELTLNISVTDVEAMRAAIKITPSDNKKTFCWMVGAWDGVQTAEEIMNGIVSMYGGWMNNGAMLYKGVQDYTGGPGSSYKYKLDAADTNYYVIAFGYAGGITTEPVMVTFKTLPAPSAEDTTFTMTASNETPYGFTIGITPSESTTYYTVNCLPNEEFAKLDLETLAEEMNASFDEILAMQQAYDPTITVAQVLSLYFYRGAYNVEATGMNPETTCSGIIMALSPETGHVVKVHTYPDIASTKAVGSVTPVVEVVGHWSGADENGAIFGQPDATKDKAITVVKYSNLENARSLFTTMLADDLTNVNNMSDAYLWGEIASNYWQSTKIAEPYSFYLADWDKVQTALAYAIDKTSGQPGGIGRAYSCATVENKRPIDELSELMDEWYPADAAKSSIAVPASVVFEDNGIVLNAMPVDVVVDMPVAEAAAEFEAPKATELSFPIIRF